jgi:hypothetical protein
MGDLPTLHMFKVIPFPMRFISVASERFHNVAVTQDGMGR